MFDRVPHKPLVLQDLEEILLPKGTQPSKQLYQYPKRFSSTVI